MSPPTLFITVALRLIVTIFVAGSSVAHLCCAAELITDEQEVNKWVRAIEVGEINRLSSLVCNIRFQVWRAEAASREDALADRYTSPPMLVEEGRYVKDERLMTQQSTFLTPRLGSGVIYSVASVQANSDGGLAMFWMGHQEGRNSGNLFQRYGIQKTVRSQLDRAVLEFVPSGMEMPFCAVTPGRISVSWIEEVVSGRDVKLLERKVTRDKDTVTLFWRYVSSGYEMTDQFSYHLGTGKYPLPKYSLIIARMGAPTGSARITESRTECFYQDYVKVTVGHLPTRVISVTFPGPDRKPEHGPMTIWKLIENRTTRPSDDDFGAPVPQEAPPFVCLRPERVPPVIDGYRIYNLARMTADDLDPRCRRGMVVVKRSSGWNRWAWATVVVLLAGVAIAIGSWWVWRRRGE